MPTATVAIPSRIYNIRIISIDGNITQRKTPNLQISMTKPQGFAFHPCVQSRMLKVPRMHQQESQHQRINQHGTGACVADTRMLDLKESQYQQLKYERWSILINYTREQASFRNTEADSNADQFRISVKWSTRYHDNNVIHLTYVFTRPIKVLPVEWASEV